MIAYLKARYKSFGYAFAGLRFIVASQPHARIHIVAAILVIICGGLVGITGQDWLWLVVAIALVWITESINTAIEFLCDVVSPDYSEGVKRAKDIAAASVLIAAIAAAIIGIIVFYPYIVALF